MFFIAVLYLTPEGTGQQPPYHSTSACRRSPTSNWRSQDSYGSPGFLAKVLLAHRVNPFVRTSHYKALALLREDLGSAYAVCTIFWGEVRRPGFILKVASSLKEAKDRYDARLSESKAIYGANRVEWPGHFSTGYSKPSKHLMPFLHGSYLCFQTIASVLIRLSESIVRCTETIQPSAASR